MSHGKVGLFSIGLAAYWPQFPGLRERLAHYGAFVGERLRGLGAEVVDVGMVDDAPSAQAAGDRFSREDVDLVVRLTQHPPEGLSARPLIRVAHILCATPGYLAQHSAITHPHDLAAHSCLSLGEQPHDDHWRFRFWGRRSRLNASNPTQSRHERDGGQSGPSAYDNRPRPKGQR